MVNIMTPVKYDGLCISLYEEEIAVLLPDTRILTFRTYSYEILTKPQPSLYTTSAAVGYDTNMTLHHPTPPNTHRKCNSDLDI